MLKPYLEAGKITGTQGLRGEIRVDPWCDSAEALCRLKRLYFEEGKQELKVVSARTQKRMAILKLEGVDSIEQADLLRNRVLYASRQDFKLEPGRYFIQDLLGVKAVDADSGRDYGAVTDVLKTGANDTRDHRRRWKGVSVPAIPMTVIEIRLEEGLMRIRPIEGF
ncbi:MAG: ribosome maturation factor RimM [[Clostridium] leptum]